MVWRLYATHWCSRGTFRHSHPISDGMLPVSTENIGEGIFPIRNVSKMVRSWDRQGWVKNGSEKRSAAQCWWIENCGELSQFVSFSQWMSKCIPDLSARNHLRRQTLERASLPCGGKRINKSIAKLNLGGAAWCREEKNALTSIQDSLRDAVLLAHFDPEQCICFYTDSSSHNLVVTQCAKDQLQLALEIQQHRPPTFLGGEFKGSAFACSTIEKEG